MPAANRIVFDAEPLIAHTDNEPGNDVVREYLDTIAVKDAADYASFVNLAEILYTIARKYDRGTADEYLDWLTNLGIEPVDVSTVWVDSSEYVLEYNPVLGDSFALATAAWLDAVLLVGGDDDYDDVSDLSIERFREGSA